MFWEKCGKIIADTAGKLIDCDNCPCPYWGLFVFVTRSYDRKTDKVNYCYQSADIKLLPVTNNCLHYSYYDMYQRSIKVNRTPDSKNQVGMVKNCVGCYLDCVEWDQNWQNCIREQEYCQDCSQIRVYRISPCFDTKKEAFEYFYFPCGIQPDSNGNYPESQWSDEYYNCAEYWMKQANKYKLNATFTFEDKEWSRSFYGTFVQDCDYMVQCYDWETGQLVYTGTDYPDNQNWDCWEYQTNCRDYVISSSNGQFWGYMPDNADYSEEQLEAVVGSAIGELNQFINQQITDQKNYQTTTDKRENSLCFKKDYQSFYGYYDYSGWGNCCSGHKWYGVRKSKLRLQAFDQTRHPKGAKGVIVDYTLKRTLRNSYEDSIVTQQKFENHFIPFEGVIDFPLADNLSRFYQCQCYSSFTGFQAQYYANQRYDIDFVVKDYKF